MEDKCLILTCSSLIEYVDAAQQSQKTAHPVAIVDRSFHVSPAKMKEEIARIIDSLDEKPDTILVAMGFCGGTWDHVSLPYRLVIPKVDDCVSLLLAVDDENIPNRKEMGHLYVYEKDIENSMMLNVVSGMSDGSLGGDAVEGIEDFTKEELFDMFFGNYGYLDIIDTGLNDCYDETYVELVQESADAVKAELGYVSGSNLLLEKLVTGRWDDQFLVAQPNQVLLHGDFFG